MRCVIDKSLSRSEIKSALEKLVELGEKKYYNAFKKLSINNGIILCYKSENGELLMVDQDNLLTQAANTIKESPYKNSVVLLSCAGNFTAHDLNKDPLVAQLVLVEDKLLYKKGDKITNKYFDGKQNEPYVFSDVYNFVTNELYKIVGDKGMLLKQQSVLDSNVKVTNKIEIQLNLTRQINLIDSMCQLKVTAKDDIYTHDIYSLDLFNYEVVKVK